MRMMVHCTTGMIGGDTLQDWFIEGRNYACYDNDGGDLVVVDEYGSEWYASERGAKLVYLLGVEAEFVKF